MQKRKFDELVSYFNRKVAEMSIETKYKMELLGMVTALGVAHEKEMSDLSETKRDLSDTISRQAAIDAVKRLSLGETDATRLAMRIGDYLERLPSAEPEQLIAEIKIDGEELQRLVDEAVERMRNEDTDEWCTDCSEYDSERHCCPRFNRVIREAVEEAKKERIKCAHCKRYDSHGHRCKWWNHGVSNVDWCSYAERKEE